MVKKSSISGIPWLGLLHGFLDDRPEPGGNAGKDGGCLENPGDPGDLQRWLGEHQLFRRLNGESKTPTKNLGMYNYVHTYYIYPPVN